MWLLVGLAVLIALIVLEGRRQRRRYGRGTGRSSLMRTGLLELQRHLEPERKVEMILEERETTERDDSGDGPTPGRRPG